MGAKLMGSASGGFAGPTIQLLDGCFFCWKLHFLVAFSPTFKLCTASKPGETSFLLTPDSIF